jgi:creatinine amidohydrolase
MSHSSHYWQDLTTLDFDSLDKSRAIAVLPLGATEQHGPHLPVSVDTDLVNGVVAASLPHLGDLPALFLPTQSIGFSPEHTAFAGTISLKATTLIALWTELGEAVAATGIRKLVLLNAHGGQAGLMDVVGRDLRQRLGMLVYSVNWYDLPEDETTSSQLSTDERRFGIHGGLAETAMMLALSPERVNMREARDFDSTSRQRAAQFKLLGNGKSAKLSWAIQDYNASGAVGNAAGASAALGQALVGTAGKQLARLLHEIDQLPPDTLRSR